ncbi:MAG TPA: L-histidine N(alpha)-methyltransferase [Xanthobacteraceae bacterium]|nr:L-histidine N(alpha)-methyltransferase [Xanthobacteraceae bacterium]
MSPTALAKVAIERERLEPGSFAAEVLAGLTAMPKRIPPKFFYDNAGSDLFEQITALPEYYPTRRELGILQKNASAIAAVIPAGAALIEFGSGSSRKTRIILGAARNLAAYVPVDISAEFLDQQVDALRREYPDIAMLPVAADFGAAFDLPTEAASRPRAGFFPGSTIGNLEPVEACTFLRQAAQVLGAGAVFVIGVDLIKDEKILYKAYNDAAGVTARFNRNLLVRMNRELGADFDVASFEHHAFFNREHNRIEMHLASSKRQRVSVCGATITFRAGETIHTENSYKYTIESFQALARGAGWSPLDVWTDAKKYFSVHVLALKDVVPLRQVNGH